MENNTVPDDQIPSRVQKYHKKNVPSDEPTILTPPKEPRKKKPASTRDERPKSSGAKGWIITIILAIVISLALRIFVFEIVMVDGDSMLPTLNSDQRVVVEKVSRYFGLPARGDIIITKYPNMPGDYVKRLIGSPGDLIEIKSNVVYVNGSPLQENYLDPSQTYADMAQKTVPAGTVFVMGDNRPKSLDSRSASIGPIPEGYLLGRGLFIIWPFDQIHILD
jgi:signal peptidase I